MMKLRFVRAVSGVAGAMALFLAVMAVVDAEGRSVQILGSNDLGQVVGGARKLTCAGSGVCTSCNGPTCKVDGQNCVVNKAGNGGCSSSATITQCVGGSWYQFCSNAATGLCGGSQVAKACPNSQGCPAPNPGCQGGGSSGCGDC